MVETLWVGGMPITALSLSYPFPATNKGLPEAMTPLYGAEWCHFLSSFLAQPLATHNTVLAAAALCLSLPSSLLSGPLVMIVPRNPGTRCRDGERAGNNSFGAVAQAALVFLSGPSTIDARVFCL